MLALQIFEMVFQLMWEIAIQRNGDASAGKLNMTIHLKRNELFTELSRGFVLTVAWKLLEGSLEGLRGRLIE